MKARPPQLPSPPSHTYTAKHTKPREAAVADQCRTDIKEAAADPNPLQVVAADQLNQSYQAQLQLSS